MKSYLLVIYFVVAFFFQVAAQAPDWVWARSASSTGTGEGTNIATDNWDNVFISGWFQDSITFGSYVLTGATNAFLAKYDSYGNVKWAKTPSGAGSSDGIDVATDVFGNSYLTGNFNFSVTFGSHTITSSGSWDFFLVKYDSSGNILWAKSAGGMQSDNAFAVTSDASGNVYITGYFNSPSLTIGAFTLINSGSINFFIAKYDSSGNVLWAKTNGGTGAVYGEGIAADAIGNEYLTGYFSSTLTIGTYTLTNAGSTDIFLAKYDSSGNVLWAKSAGGMSSDYCYSVATDDSNNAYLTGDYLSSSILFGPYTLTNAGNFDAFLVKYNPSGNVVWAKDIGSTGAEYGYCVAADRFNKIFVTGSFRFTTLNFDTITLPYPSGALDAMWLAGYDSSGHALFAKALSSGGDDQNGVSASPSGCIYTGGDFEIPSFIVGHDTLIRSGANNENVFVAKLCYSGVTASFNCSDTAFCNESGQCISFFDHSVGNPTSWHWTFTGATPDTSSLQNPDSICFTTPGTYPVTLVVSNGSTTDTLTVSPLIIFGTSVAQPTITIRGGDTLVSSHGSSYQWYFNGSPITGATDSFYVEHQAGTYSVEISDNTGGCHALSVGVPVGVIELSGGGGISIYPNPADKEFTIYNLQFTNGIPIKIYDVLGNKVYDQQLRTSNFKLQTVLDVSSLSNGIYLLKIDLDGRIVNSKFLVMHK